MSIQSEIARIKSNVAGAYMAVADMGGTLPEVQNSDNLENSVRTVPGKNEYIAGNGITIKEGAIIVTHPNVPLTQAEYDALTEADKHNGTVYIITDQEIPAGVSQEEADARYLQLSGGTMQGELEIGVDCKLIILGRNGMEYSEDEIKFATKPFVIEAGNMTPDSGMQIVDRAYSDCIIIRSPVEIAGKLSVSDHRIAGVADPTMDLDAANKRYVDGKLSTIPKLISIEFASRFAGGTYTVTNDFTGESYGGPVPEKLTVLVAVKGSRTGEYMVWVNKDDTGSAFEGVFCYEEFGPVQTVTLT